MIKSIQKALLSLIFLASLCIIGTPVHAADGDTFTASIQNDEGTAFDITFKVISETEKTVQLGIGGPVEENRSFQGGLTLSDPVSHNGDAYTVVGIADNAFDNNGDITSLKGDNITTVGNSAFWGCTALRTVDLPQASTIGINTFYGCIALTTIKLPQATAIGGAAFGDCASLTTVDLPQATTIGETAFYGCYALTTVNLPQATEIASRAFIVCIALTTVNLPQATSIGEQAFDGCYALTTINLPKVTTIGINAFWNCTALKTIVLGIKDESYSFADIRNYPQYIYLPQGSAVTDLKFGGVNYVADGKGEIKTYALNITGPSKIESRPGAKAEFTVNADIQSDIDDTFLSKELAYQWQKKTDETWTNLEGETGKTLTFATLTAEQLGTYRCQIMPVNYPVLMANSSEADVTIMLLSPDAAASTITGIEEGKAYLKGESLTFTVNGAGMDNNNPYEGDTRYIPVGWEVNPSGTFTDSYTVTVDTKDMAIGQHKLQVSFAKQQYSSGQWIKTGEENYTKSVNFTLENEQATSTTAKATPKTSDTSNVMLLGLVMALSLCSTVLVQKFKKCKNM